MANAGDRRQIEAATRREKGIRKGELDGMRYLMDAPMGRALMHRMLTITGAEDPLPFTPNAMNLARDSGIQSVGLALLSEVRQACPEQESIMRREAAIVAQRADMQEDVDNDDR